MLDSRHVPYSLDYYYVDLLYPTMRDLYYQPYSPKNTCSHAWPLSHVADALSQPSIRFESHEKDVTTSARETRSSFLSSSRPSPRRQCRRFHCRRPLQSVVVETKPIAAFSFRGFSVVVVGVFVFPTSSRHKLLTSKRRLNRNWHQRLGRPLS